MLFFECADRHGGDPTFAGKSACPRINWYVKTPGLRPSMGVARSGLWAPVITKKDLEPSTILDPLI